MVAVPVNAALSAAEATTVIKHSEARALIYGDGLQETASQLTGMVPKVDQFISMATSDGNAHNYETLLENAADTEPDIEIAPDDIWMIMYTSGSTGAPKGVIATHRNLVANTTTMVVELEIVASDITLRSGRCSTTAGCGR